MVFIKAYYRYYGLFFMEIKVRPPKKKTTLVKKNQPNQDLFISTLQNITEYYGL